MDIFQDKTKSIPKTTPSTIERIDFDKSDIGARKSHTNGAFKKADHAIRHVKG